MKTLYEKAAQMEIKIVENRFTRHEKKNKNKPDKKKTGKMSLIFQDLNGGLQWKSKMINKKIFKENMGAVCGNYCNPGNRTVCRDKEWFLFKKR